MWTLIQNNLKVFIDPFVFSDRSIENISKQVSLVNTLQDYFRHLDPSLCKVTFFFPRYIEERLNMRRTFMPNDKVEFIDTPPEKIIEVIKEIKKEENLEALNDLIRTYNEWISLAVENKCIFILTQFEVHEDVKNELMKNHGLEFVKLENLQERIEQFLQGFYNYFKFRVPVYGINAPDIAHAMSEEFFQRVLIPFENEINQNQPSSGARERTRSFIHNRYLDILTTVDEINFYKMQQRISDIEKENLDNKKPHFHGFIRYYLNYYLFLLWGAIDHMGWIINDLFKFPYNPDSFDDQKKVGLNKSKKEFLEKIKLVNEDLYKHIISDSFQEWRDFFGQLRNQNAHREMFSASPLLITTEESKITDEEIDKIIYKDHPPISEEDASAIKNVMGEKVFIEMEQNQKINDRNDYRLAKLKKGLDHFAVVKRDGKEFIMDPVGRIPTDIKNLKDFIEKVVSSYYLYNKKAKEKNSLM